MKSLSILAFLGGWVAAGVAWAAPVEITLPADPARLAESPLPGYAMAQAFCATCHSADYMRTQPVSSRTYWQATVTKMQKVFGAPIPDEAMGPITDYLVRTYGAERAATAAPASRGDLTPAASSPQAKSPGR
jgi:cytochrome c553